MDWVGLFTTLCLLRLRTLHQIWHPSKHSTEAARRHHDRASLWISNGPCFSSFLNTNISRLKGPMVLAPLSEIPAIGRNPVYISTLALFVLFQVPTALATSFSMLLVFRFVTGVLGSPALATGGASIGDMYPPQKRALAIGIWGIAAVGSVPFPLTWPWSP